MKHTKEVQNYSTDLVCLTLNRQIIVTDVNLSSSYLQRQYYI